MARKRLPRLVAGGALAALALGVGVPARAQSILDRARDRARQALARNEKPARPACSPRDSITDAVVTRYVRVLQARQAEIRRIATENSPAGRYFAAMLLRDSLKNRHGKFLAHYGPDWDRYEQLQNRPPSTDAQVNLRNETAAAQVEQDIDETRVQLPDVPWDQMEAARNRQREAERQADGSGLPFCFDAEDIQKLVGSLLGERLALGPAPDSAYLQAGLGREYRGSELTVIRAHAAELSSALGFEWPSDAEAAAARRAAQREAAAQAARDSADHAMAEWGACRQRIFGNVAAPTANVPEDSIRAWRTQLRDAQKRGDNAAAMAIGQKIMAMNPGAMQQTRAMNEAEAQAQQQCGPMPGTPR